MSNVTRSVPCRFCRTPVSKTVVDLGIDVPHAMFVLTGDGGDGLLASVLGNRELRTTVDFGLSYTTGHGLHLKSGSGLTVELPVVLTVGPLSLQEVSVTVAPTAEAIDITVATTLDVTLGLRMLRKYWGLSLVGGLALAVVIGICTVVFLYLNLVGSTALPIEDGDRVVAIQLWDSSAHRRAETSLDDFARWRDSMESLEQVGAFRTVGRNLIADGRAGERVAVAEMSAAGFSVARTAPFCTILIRPVSSTMNRRGSPIGAVR